MRDLLPLAERLSPDTLAKLERAADRRFESAEVLRNKSRVGCPLLLWVQRGDVAVGRLLPQRRVRSA